MSIFWSVLRATEIWRQVFLSTLYNWELEWKVQTLSFN